MSTTLIINNTQDVLKLKLRDQQFDMKIVTIPRDGHHSMKVSPQETYHEFALQSGHKGNGTEEIIVTSDELCDNKRITIEESTDGKLCKHQVTRESPDKLERGPLPPTARLTSWFSWVKRLWVMPRR